MKSVARVCTTVGLALVAASSVSYTGVSKWPEVRYLVIGGYAVGFHDRPRATKHLDLLLADDPDNVARAKVR